ncbi:uncharacterized protein PHALS_15446 [Plasmopara halstedii]|uniref:Uncharacterized protein n=1 Tax=Plasmopara halstedii TaxID=4781 RepID=A0A0P1AHU3_PLAHL|nr:uncharacterized protein PHALS_15446 [Plasmopara halstedii]CEG40417.1 hypothetical protein PHALS_15446 [Plasmopara halstedii]|eukprot:XP_024576786.1 hypothetical protein PHALS_15446 [Plasmopara halstedii]
MKSRQELQSPQVAVATAAMAVGKSRCRFRAVQTTMCALPNTNIVKIVCDDEQNNGNEVIDRRCAKC